MRTLTTLVVAALFLVVGYVAEADRADADQDVLGPGLVTVDLDIEHSRFSDEEIRVRPGTTVQFRINNGDPIHHEFVVGPESVHRAHETGTEEAHPPVPGELSLDPQEAGFTFYQFDEPGEMRFVCHLPRHEAYGMVGRIVVVD